MVMMKRNSITFTEPDGTDIVRITDIIIPEDFKKTKCSFNKIRWSKEYFQRNGHFDKPISVIAEINERGEPNSLVLINEYSRYRAALELGLWFVSVKYIDINEMDL